KRLALMDGNERRHVFLVPLNPVAADYEDLLSEVLGRLERLLIDGKDAHRVLYRLDPGLYQ
ncbi:MAG: hypothetical protein ABW022_11630, partial [Actinoplanes sp.]